MVTLLYGAAMVLIVNASDVSKKETSKGEGGEGTPTSSLFGLAILMVWSVLEALRENYKVSSIPPLGTGGFSGIRQITEESQGIRSDSPNSCLPDHIAFPPRCHTPYPQ